MAEIKDMINSLNNDQKVVLEYLLNNTTALCVLNLYEFMSDFRRNSLPKKIEYKYIKLSFQQENELVSVFANILKESQISRALRIIEGRE